MIHNPQLDTLPASWHFIVPPLKNTDYNLKFGRVFLLSWLIIYSLKTVNSSTNCKTTDLLTNSQLQIMPSTIAEVLRQILRY